MSDCCRQEPPYGGEVEQVMVDEAQLTTDEDIEWTMAKYWRALKAPGYGNFMTAHC